MVKKTRYRETPVSSQHNEQSPPISTDAQGATQGIFARRSRVLALPLALVLVRFALESASVRFTVWSRRIREGPIAAATIRPRNLGALCMVGVEVKMNVNIFLHACFLTGLMLPTSRGNFDEHVPGQTPRSSICSQWLWYTSGTQKAPNQPIYPKLPE